MLTLWLDDPCLTLLSCDHSALRDSLGMSDASSISVSSIDETRREVSGFGISDTRSSGAGVKVIWASPGMGFDEQRPTTCQIGRYTIQTAQAIPDRVLRQLSTTGADN